MRHFAYFLAAVTAHSVISTPDSFAADWTQFRGANGSAVSPETNLPAGFSDTSGLRWKATLPGRGVSSPVIVGGRVYVTCSNGAKDDRLHVVCLDAATGTQLWQRQLSATGNTACHPKTCMAAPTPVADETGVYALFATGDVAAYDRDGTLRWYRSLVGDYPTLSNQVGMAASPILHSGKLIVPMDNTGDSFLAAIDTKTGKNLWKVERPRDVNWISPLLRTVNGKTEVIFPGTRTLVAYDVETGAKRWSSPNPTNGIPTPTLVGDLLLLPSRGVVALNLKGDKPEQTWTSQKLGSGMSSPLVYDGRVYACNPRGDRRVRERADRKDSLGGAREGAVLRFADRGRWEDLCHQRDGRPDDVEGRRHVRDSRGEQDRRGGSGDAGRLEWGALPARREDAVLRGSEVI